MMSLTLISRAVRANMDLKENDNCLYVSNNDDRCIGMAMVYYLMRREGYSLESINIELGINEDEKAVQDIKDYLTKEVYTNEHHKFWNKLRLIQNYLTINN